MELKMKNKKIGLDDAIVDYGVDFLLARIEKPCWTFNSMRIEDFSIEISEDFLKSMVIYQKSERAKILDKLKLRNNKFSKGTSELLLKDYCSEWKQFKPLEEEKKNELTWNSFEESFVDLFDKLSEKIKLVEGLYRNSKTLSFVFVSEVGTPFYLNSMKRLSSFLSNHIQYRKVVSTEDGVKPLAIEHIPENHLAAFSERERNFEKFKEVDFITNIPQVFDGKIISKRGYDESSKIFYSGPEIALEPGLETIRTFVKSFPFESEIDQVNFFGVLVSLFFIQKYVGQHPAVIIQGDEQNLGKTTLAECISILFQDKEPGLLPLAHDEELKKIISGIVQDNNIVLIDNIKGLSENSVVSSAMLESLITAPELMFRVLGENRVMSRPNNVLFIFTLNKGAFSDDLVTRSICISLSRKSKETMDYSFNPKEFVTQNRSKILGEIANFIEHASKNDYHNIELSDKFENFKFKKWAYEISKIMKVNNVKGFLANQNHLAKRVNPLQIAVENFISQKILAYNVARTTGFTASDIVREIPSNVFNGETSYRSKVTKVGKIMSQLKKIQLDEGVVSVNIESSKEGGKSVSYYFEKGDS